jgi:hypothetical protein
MVSKFPFLRNESDEMRKEEGEMMVGRGEIQLIHLRSSLRRWARDGVEMIARLCQKNI